MGGRIVSVISACVTVLAASAAPPLVASPPLAAASKWSLNYDRDRCVLARQFGEGDDRVFAQFVRYAPGDWFEFNLVGRNVATSHNLADLQIRFGETGPFVRTQAMTGTLGGLPAIFASGRLDNIKPVDDRQDPPSMTPQAEAAVTTAQIRLGARSWALALGAMEKPMAALHTCEAALVKQWGLDPAAQAALASHPRPRTPTHRWLRTEDYPSAQLMRGEQAITVFRLMVDAAGRPTDCAVQSNVARDQAFAKITCGLLMKRARFEPARAAAGEPVAGYYVDRVRWVIP